MKKEDIIYGRLGVTRFKKNLLVNEGEKEFLTNNLQRVHDIVVDRYSLKFTPAMFTASQLRER